MMKSIRVVTVYPNFANKGGAQNVALQLAEKLNEGSKPIVLAETQLMDIVEEYKARVRFESFSYKAIDKYADSHTVFLSHHRKSTSLLLFYKRIFRKKDWYIIHVAHNTFNNLRWCCLFPRTIIAVSNGVKENLVGYFRLPEQRVKIIFNGVQDAGNKRNIRENDGEIHILLPGRICPVKQQVELVKQTKGKLFPHIHIYFAGDGEDKKRLIEEIGDSAQYHYIGFIDMKEHLNQYDYICLFSQNEGLPLSLIEGLMFGKPLVTNQLQAVLDVNKPNETGFAYDDIYSLTRGLNLLPLSDSEEYNRMAANARRRYEEYFMEETMINEYKKVIQSNIRMNFTPYCLNKVNYYNYAA